MINNKKQTCVQKLIAQNFVIFRQKLILPMTSIVITSSNQDKLFEK